MNPLIITMFYVVGAFVFWLLPLYWVCQYAERQKKDHRIVFLVGLLTGWLIGLIVALLLPALGDAELEKMQRKSQREPMGETAIVLAGIGFCSLMLLGFMAWLTWWL